MNDQDTIDAALFAARPQRLTNCTTCQGRGHVDRPYVLKHTPMLVGAPTSAITATVVGTAFIFEATREASEIATRAKRDVAFYFMDKLVIARPNDDPDALARRWWQEFYGKSYEESVNDR